MSNEAPDQSMEEVLASIRRVISADADAARRPPATRAAQSDETPLELGSPPAEALLSPRSEQASKAALATLESIAIDPRARPDTLDGLVREMLRPMLKQWLDDHLPDIVERIVAREVARVAGR